MKVIVTKYLDVRVGRPSLEADTFQRLAPGSELEVEDEIHDGDAILGSTKWLADKAGNFYWAAGTNYKEAGVIQSSHTNTDYNLLLSGIDQDLKSNKGHGVRVCVMDTGCINNSCISEQLIGIYDATTGQQGQFVDASFNGHGTGVSGLIAAKANQSMQESITGIAALSEVMIVRVSQENSIKSGFVLNGLQWLIDLPEDKRPHILNLSFDLPEEEEIKQRIEILVKMGVVVVAAAQNNEGLFDTRGVFFPASMQSVIAVGCLKLDVYHESEKQLNDAVNFILPDIGFNVLHKFDKVLRKNIHGCSYSTAVVSASLALIRSKHPELAASDIVDVLMGISQSLESFNDNETLQIFKSEKSLTA